MERLKENSGDWFKMDQNKVFAQLCSKVKVCTLCRRMRASSRILGPSSGRVPAELMFIGEAPGRLGADATEIPFHGDKAGDNFEELLEFVGISREETFVTNAVLCNPKDARGNNAPPSSGELHNCSNFLRRQIDLVQPRLVVTLGAAALRATTLIEKHNLTLKNAVRTRTPWYGRWLVPLYHPGQRAMIHRSRANQRSDYQFIAEQLRRKNKGARVTGKTSERVARVVAAILNSCDEISYFALHKILYLLEVQYLNSKGRRLTGAYFIRQEDGPYCTDLQIRKLTKTLPWIRVRSDEGNLRLNTMSNADLFPSEKNSGELDVASWNFVQTNVKRLSRHSDSQLKTAAYLTQPMRYLLRLEKMGVNTYNGPIFRMQKQGVGASDVGQRVST